MRILSGLAFIAFLAAAPAWAASYSASEHEQRMLRRLVEDDVEGWRTSGDKALDYSEWPTVVRVPKLVDAYSENEVAADLAYKGKRVIVSAVVDAIRKDAADQPFLSLSAGSGPALRSLHARFPESSQADLALVKKKQQVTVSCVVRGMLLSQPVLTDCSLLNPDRVTDSTMKKVEAALRGEREANEGVAALVVFGLAFARLTKPDSTCITKPMNGNKHCEAELDRLMRKGGGLEAAAETVRKELLGAGLKWAALAVKDAQDAGR